MELYDKTNYECSKLITNNYSTSFSLGIKALDKRFHLPIYAIYGFVRYADEIVDTFHTHDKQALLNQFKADAYKAIHEKISLNPVLHAFQHTVNKYDIDHDLIDAFLYSMSMDLSRREYSEEGYKQYIYGSAEVVGLMCLQVFCDGDKHKYAQLQPAASRLGAAFQKVNFLRDLKSDYQALGRVYFPGVNFNAFTENVKREIEADIMADFDAAYQGILQLPTGARLGVYLAYIYYLTLFKKIQRLSPNKIQTERVRVPDNQKILLLLTTYFRGMFNYL